ncbi:MAG: bacterial transcriptional activator domain-containing protein [Candidatus Dormibacteraceae bacterium]
MLHDLSLTAAAISIALLVGLVLPKRRLPDLRARLRDLRVGRRRWLYGAPSGWSGSPRPVGRGRLLSEFDRVLELGAPVWLLARIVEDRSSRVRLEEATRWTGSAQAILNSHAAGTISEEELIRHLQARSLPAPAAKARSRVVGRRPATPIDWWMEREELARQHAANRSEAAPPTIGHLAEAIDGVVPATSGDRDLLSIAIVGRFEMVAAGTDLAGDLLRHKVAAFIVVYLMARTILNRKLRLTKAELGDELTPGLGPEKQRKRLTNRLVDMRSELPPELAERIVVGKDDSIAFDLARTSIDYERLLALARECASKDGLLSPELAAEAARMLATSEGEVLPIWDELEQALNGARGAGGEFVRELRQRAEEARVTILGALAANHLARHEPQAAIPLLERALERQPEREDLARRLRMAYLETGQHGRAAEIQRDHALDA